MAQAFSLNDKDTYADFEENEDSTLTITLEAPGETLSVTVDAGDLGRALLTASPAFATGVSELAQRAILIFLGHDVEEEMHEASANHGDQAE